MSTPPVWQFDGCEDEFTERAAGVTQRVSERQGAMSAT
jgi:hypothetical protein